MLKRHLRTHYDMSPRTIARSGGRSPDYPMVAPNYAEKRRALAHSIGLGRRKAVKTPGAVVTGAGKTIETVAEPIGSAVKPSRKKSGIAAAKAAAATISAARASPLPGPQGKQAARSQSELTTNRCCPRVRGKPGHAGKRSVPLFEPGERRARRVGTAPNGMRFE